MGSEFKRMPAVEKKISGLDERDIRVSIRGAVIASQDQTIILDDGSAKIKASFDSPINQDLKMARVIGRVIPFENGLEIHGEILQDMSKLDIDVFKKLSSINRL